MAPMTTSVKAEAKLGLEVRPAHSQVVLVALAIISVVPLLLGAYLLAGDKTAGWAFVVIGSALAAAVLWAWTRSQADIDLVGSHPTKLISADGASVSTDSRVLARPGGTESISTMLAAMMVDRRPLPMPAGTVASNGTLIPNSESEALALASQINKSVEDLNARATEQLRDAMRGPTALQGAMPHVDVLPIASPGLPSGMQTAFVGHPQPGLE